MFEYSSEYDEYRDIRSITSDDLLAFLAENTKGQRQSTKHFKYTILKTLFNFINGSTDIDILNPCDTEVMKKAFRTPKGHRWTILEKDMVDEMIFKTINPRNRLMLELMARGGMRIGEVLKLRVEDVEDRKLHIIRPKSGKQSEIVYIPQKVADRLKEFIQEKG